MLQTHSLTSEIGKRRKTKFGRIDSRSQVCFYYFPDYMTLLLNVYWCIVKNDAYESMYHNMFVDKWSWIRDKRGLEMTILTPKTSMKVISTNGIAKPLFNPNSNLLFKMNYYFHIQIQSQSIIFWTKIKSSKYLTAILYDKTVEFPTDIHVPPNWSTIHKSNQVIPCVL